MTVPQLHGDAVGHRLADARHLQGVGQTVVHEDAARKREDLGLVLEAPERRRKDKTVVVAPEIGARLN